MLSAGRGQLLPGFPERQQAVWWGTLLGAESLAAGLPCPHSKLITADRQRLKKHLRCPVSTDSCRIMPFPPESTGCQTSESESLSLIQGSSEGPMTSPWAGGPQGYTVASPSIAVGEKTFLQFCGREEGQRLSYPFLQLRRLRLTEARRLLSHSFQISQSLYPTALTS